MLITYTDKYILCSLVLKDESFLFYLAFFLIKEDYLFYNLRTIYMQILQILKRSFKY